MTLLPPNFPKIGLSQFPPLRYFTTPTQKSFQISLAFGRWRRPSAMASSDKIWHYEQVGFLPRKISCQERFPDHFVGRRWKSRTQNTPKSAESVGIATSTYQRWHYSHLRKQYSTEKGHYLTDFLFAKAVFKRKSQVRSERVFLVCMN